MNNKVLSVVLIAGIATTGFAGISAANEGLLGEEVEQRIDSIEAKFDSDKGGYKGFKGYGKRAGFKMLTDEEKQALESMTDEEKQAFFEAKKLEMQEKREAHKAVIDALIAGETLTSEQEELRADMIEKLESREGKRDSAEVIEKVLKGETLTDEDEAILTQMQEKRVEREAEKAKIEAMTDEEKEAYFAEKKAERQKKKEEIKALIEKVRNGETLTEEEQEKVDNAKEFMKKRKDHRGERNFSENTERGTF